MVAPKSGTLPSGSDTILRPGQKCFNPCYCCGCLCGGTCSLRTGCIVVGIFQLLIGIFRMGVTAVCWRWILRQYMRKAELEGKNLKARLEAIYEAVSVNGTLTQQIVFGRSWSRYFRLPSTQFIQSKNNKSVFFLTVFLNAVICDGLFCFAAILILVGASQLLKWVCLTYTAFMVTLMCYRTLGQVMAVQAIYHAIILFTAFENESTYLGNIGRIMSELAYFPLVEYLLSIIFSFWLFMLCGGALFYQIHRGDYPRTNPLEM